jgi:hypothetical protein
MSVRTFSIKIIKISYENFDNLPISYCFYSGYRWCGYSCLYQRDDPGYQKDVVELAPEVMH